MAEWYPRVALALLAYMAPKSCELFTVSPVCSIPTPNMKDQIKGLDGLHDVTVQGRDRVSINVVDPRPVPEGVGSALALSSTQPVAVADFGYQNTTVAGYDPRTKTMIGVESLKVGVGALFEQIAVLTNTTGEKPSAEEIRLGVEAGTYELNGYSGTSFKQAYLQAFEPWAKARVHEAKTKAGYIFGKCPVKMFAGGGSMLPGMTDVAAKVGCGICENPQETEVRGIYRM